MDREELRWPIYRRLIRLNLHDPKAYPRTRPVRWFPQVGWYAGHGDVVMQSSCLDHEVDDLWVAILLHAPVEVELNGPMLEGRVGPRRKRE